MCACFLVVSRVEGVLDDAADHLRRETSVGEFRDEGCGEGVEVDALVGFEATRGDNFLDVRVVRFWPQSAAKWSGVFWSTLGALTSAPASRSTCKQATRASGLSLSKHTQWRGLRPFQPNMFGETPSSSSRCNASRSARLAALCTALAGMILHARCSRERVPRRPGRERYVKCCA